MNVNRPVESAINGLSDLNGTRPATAFTDAVERLERGSLNALQGVLNGQPAPFEAGPFLGGSSNIVLKTADLAGRIDEVRIETIRHRDLLYVQLVEKTMNRGDNDVLDYRIRMADGTPVPAWLRRVGPETFAGYPDANAGMMDLSITVVRRDGLVTTHDIRLDPLTGQISDVSLRPDQTLPEAAQGPRVPLFTEQLDMLAPPPPVDTTDLERALGLQ